MKSNNYGTTIRKIRLEKKLSQNIVSDKKLSRSLIAKIENNTVNPSIEKFHVILQQLNISFDEFFYIHSGYKLSLQDQITQSFYSSLSNSNAKMIDHLLEQCDAILKDGDNQHIRELKSVMLAMNEVSQDRFEQAVELATPIWIRLSKCDNWYLSDIKLINCILYMFPTDTAITIANHALKHLGKYENFLVNKRLKVGLKLNLATLLIQNKESYDFIIDLLNETIIESKQQRLYDCYAIAMFKKGLCMAINKKEDPENHIDTALKIFEMLNEKQLVNSLLREKNFLIPEE